MFQEAVDKAWSNQIQKTVGLDQNSSTRLLAGLSKISARLQAKVELHSRARKTGLHFDNYIRL